MNDNEIKETAAPDDGVVKTTGSRFYALLVSWGIPAVVAAAIVGAVYAALVALGVLSLPGCTMSIDLMPDGAQRWEGVLNLPQTVNPEK